VHETEVDSFQGDGFQAPAANMRTQFEADLACWITVPLGWVLIAQAKRFLYRLEFVTVALVNKLVQADGTKKAEDRNTFATLSVFHIISVNGKHVILHED
jgi:hypothetical protein